MGDDLVREETPMVERLFIGGSHHGERNEVPVSASFYQMFPKRGLVSVESSDAVSAPGAVEKYIVRPIDGTLTDAFGREEIRRQLVMVHSELGQQEAYGALVDVLVREFIGKGEVVTPQPSDQRPGSDLVIPG